MPDTPGAPPALRPVTAGTTGAKRALRARVRAERRSRPAASRAADGAAIAELVLGLPEVRAARSVAVYASTPDEPSTAALRTALRRAAVRVLLPVVPPAREPGLDWAVDVGDLVPGAGPGMPEPPGPRLGGDGIRAADVVIVPALAVDTLGQRLGQGGGFYDRALPLVPRGVPVVALVHEGEVLDAAIEPVPADPHDVGVDAVVTPSRCLRLPPRRR